VRKGRKLIKFRQLEGELKEMEAWVHNARITTVEWMKNDVEPLLQSATLLRLEHIHREVLSLMEKLKVRPKATNKKAA